MYPALGTLLVGLAFVLALFIPALPLAVRTARHNARMSRIPSHHTTTHRYSDTTKGA